MSPYYNWLADLQWCTFKSGGRICDYEWKRSVWNLTEVNCGDFEGRAAYKVDKTATRIVPGAFGHLILVGITARHQDVQPSETQDEDIQGLHLNN